jgi:endonuclease/exonuclease/phosphatase family metal-dependent hydrolase
MGKYLTIFIILCIAFGNYISYTALAAEVRELAFRERIEENMKEELCTEGVDSLRPIVLRVGTFNIHHGEGNDGIMNLKRIADVILKMNVDIIGLQEVDKNWGDRSGWTDQVTGLSSFLQMQGRFGPALSKEILRKRGYYGNAIFSKYPILSIENHPLRSITGGEDRACLEALIDTGGEKILFLSVHLGLSAKERRHHLSMLLSHIETSEYPVILVGDFNAEEDEFIQIMSGRLKDAFSVAGSEDGSTFGFRSSLPNVRIDYIWVSDGFEVINASTLPAEASDHYPVIAVVKLLKEL